MILPLLKLRNTGGSLKKGEVRNPQGLNGKKEKTQTKLRTTWGGLEEKVEENPQGLNGKNKLTNCNNVKVDDNPYPPPEDNPFKKQEQEQEQEDLNLSACADEKNEKIPKTASYAFAGKVVRLNKEDFEAWEKAYSYLDLVPELQSRDDWLAAQPPDVQKGWFITTSNYLRNRNDKARKEVDDEGENEFQWVNNW